MVLDDCSAGLGASSFLQPVNAKTDTTAAIIVMAIIFFIAYTSFHLPLEGSEFSIRVLQLLLACDGAFQSDGKERTAEVHSAAPPL